MLKYAFKEWAVICKALAEGRQALILRKGGIAEKSGEFRLEHERFWLFPTYTHQQEGGIKTEAADLLRQVKAEQPPSDIMRLSHFAEVTGVYHVKTLMPVQMLSHLHIWSDETVEKRFNYRYPGLFVLPVRVYRAEQVFELPNRAQYDGCRSWVELAQELPTNKATAILNNEEMEDIHRSLDLLLNPTALA